MILAHLWCTSRLDVRSVAAVDARSLPFTHGSGLWQWRSGPLRALLRAPCVAPAARRVCEARRDPPVGLAPYPGWRRDGVGCLVRSPAASVHWPAPRWVGSSLLLACGGGLGGVGGVGPWPVICYN